MPCADIGQFHTWLLSKRPDGQPIYLLTLLPGYPLLNFAVVTASAWQRGPGAVHAWPWCWCAWLYLPGPACMHARAPMRGKAACTRPTPPAGNLLLVTTGARVAPPPAAPPVLTCSCLPSCACSLRGAVTPPLPDNQQPQGCSGEPGARQGTRPACRDCALSRTHTHTHTRPLLPSPCRCPTTTTACCCATGS